MANQDDIKRILLKYIAGEADEDETKKVEYWLSQNPENFKEFEQLWDLWYAVGTATNVFRFNVDSGWEAIAGEVGNNNAFMGESPYRRKGWWRMMAAATLLLILGVTGFCFFSYQGKKKSDNVPPKSDLVLNAEGEAVPLNPGKRLNIYDFSFRTRPGERTRIKLPDSSRVWLNGNTSIHFVAKPDGDQRVLYLEGQAFFEVAHRDDKPFIVKTKHAEVKVLGTRFDVTAYPKEAVTEVVLTRGRIIFSAKVNDKYEEYRISPGEKISMDQLSEQLKLEKVDTAFYSSWKDDRFFFRNESFGQVAKALERRYNVTIEFRDQDLLGKEMNGSLEKESLQEALEAFRLTLQFKYKMKGQHVVIY